jgi:hypothetical protein
MMLYIAAALGALIFGSRWLKESARFGRDGRLIYD